MESSGDLNLKASHGSKVATDYSPLQKYEQFMDQTSATGLIPETQT